VLVPSRLSKKGAAFIGRFEGLRLKPYNDPVGNATVGYGHLIHHGPVTELDLKHYLGLTQAGAEELLASGRRRGRNGGEGDQATHPEADTVRRARLARLQLRPRHPRTLYDDRPSCPHAQT
jgi:GH24 family phage-related lysozyme (muramidase)